MAYTIEALGEDTVKLEGGIELSHEDTVQMLRLPRAMTYASVLGKETDGRLCLHDTANTHMTLEHMYVALSRTRKSALVKVE